MWIYREKSIQRYWDKVQSEGCLRFVALRGSLLGALLTGLSFHAVRTSPPLPFFLFVALCWTFGLLAMMGLWFLCFHRRKFSN